MDKRGWHIYAKLVCEHQQIAVCARPQWLRVMVLHHPILGDVLSRPVWWSKLLRKIHWAFPALFGGKALMCANCHMVAFQSKFAEAISRFVGFLTGLEADDQDAILMIDEDLQNLTDAAKEGLHAEDF